MAQYGMTITKSVAFRGGVQHFGNTYYYSGPIPNVATGELDDLVNAVVAIEKAAHGNNVQFVRARLWSSDGTANQNQMIIDKALTGTGAQAINTNMDRERAFLIQFRAGVDSRGRPVYLRKWFHLLASAYGGSTLTADHLSQNSQLPQATRDALVALGNSLKTVSSGTMGSPMTLQAKSGRNIDGATIAHKWLEHRQFGEEWRG